MTSGATWRRWRILSQAKNTNGGQLRNRGAWAESREQRVRGLITLFLCSFLSSPFNSPSSFEFCQLLAIEIACACAMPSISTHDRIYIQLRMI